MYPGKILGVSKLDPQFISLSKVKEANTEGWM